MKANIIKISGFEAAFSSMFMSKRTWTPELQEEISKVCDLVLDKNGFPYKNQDVESILMFNKWLSTLTKMTVKHITVGRFINFSCIVEGLHRAAQDDFDSHARRLENKIIRNSTRLATFESNEKSEFYKDKILLMDEVIDILKNQNINIELPETISYNNKIYVRSTNGYIDKDYENDKDVKRGLYPMCIPSNFVFECNLTEWGHIVKERDCNSNANPELKDMIEQICDQLEKHFYQFNKELFYNIKN